MKCNKKEQSLFQFKDSLKGEKEGRYIFQPYQAPLRLFEEKINYMMHFSFWVCMA